MQEKILPPLHLNQKSDILNLNFKKTRVKRTGRSYMVIITWIVLLIAFLVIEFITVGLTTIWFAGGALVALILAALGVGIGWQIAAFFVVSLVLLFFTRPFVVKCIKPNRVRTNYESAIGKQVLITEKVDNLTGTGTADLDGQEWTARMEDDGETLEAGMQGEVVNISGVKLILRPVGQQNGVAGQ